jgi:hypothetical protein
MKYVVTWTARANTDETAQVRSLQVFGKWTPSEAATFHQFLGRLDGRGGFAVVETDDPTTIARDASIFGAWFDFEVYPCLEITEIAATGQEAVEFRSSVS